MVLRLLLLVSICCLAIIARAQVQPIVVVKDTAKTIVVEGIKYYTFTPKAQQTLYSIAKAYNVTVDDINAANPTVKESGLKIGQAIKIPAGKSAVLPTAKTEAGDNTPSSSAPDSLELKQLMEKCRNATKKEVYNVAFFLPIYAKENNFNDKYTVGGEFYEGALMGIEDFKGATIKLQVQVFDTENDTIEIKEILKKTDLKKYDLIVGPLFASAFQIVANQAKADSVVCVSPFSQIFKVVGGFPNVHKITPSATTIVDQSAQYIAKRHGRQNVIFVTNANKKDAGSMALYRAKLDLAFGKLGYTFKELTFKVGSKIPEDLLSTSGENFLVFPCSDQALVGTFVDQLHDLSYKYILRIWGLNQWQNYDNLAFDKLNRLNLHFARTGYADTENKAVEVVNRRCREKYKTDASEYFLQGYDIITYYIAMLQKYGTGVNKCVLCEPKYKGLQTDFKMGLSNAANGLENTAIQIMQYKNNGIIVVN